MATPTNAELTTILNGFASKLGEFDDLNWVLLANNGSLSLVRGDIGTHNLVGAASLLLEHYHNRVKSEINGDYPITDDDEDQDGD